MAPPAKTPEALLRESRLAFATGNYSKTRKLLGLAARKGLAEGLYRFGTLHHHGLGGPQDYVEARRLYGLAST